MKDWNKIIKKISIFVILALFIQVITPVLTYAFPGFFMFPLPDGKLRGYVYVQDPNKVSVKLENGSSVTTITYNTPGVMLAPIGPSYLYDDSNRLFYNVNFNNVEFTSNMSPDKITAFDGATTQGFTKNIDPDGYVRYFGEDTRLGYYRITGQQFISTVTANTYVQPNSNLVSFIPAQNDSNAIQLTLPFSGEGNMINFNKLSLSDFILRDVTMGTDVQLTDLNRLDGYDRLQLPYNPYNHILTLESLGNLIKDHQYVLKLSSISESNEIKLPEKGTYSFEFLLGNIVTQEDTKVHVNYKYFKRINQIYFDDVIIKDDNKAPVWPEQSILTVSNINKTGGVLSWTGAVDEVGVVGYKIYSVTESTYSEIASVNDVHSYNLISLNSDTSYTFILKAVDGAGNWSEYSPTVTLHTDKNPPVISVGGGSFIPPSTSNQGSTFVELNLDVDTEVTKEVSQDGQSFTKVTVDMGKLTQLLADSPQLEHIVIPVIGVDPAVKVVLPLKAIPDFRQNTVIEVKTNDASYKFPTRLLKEFPEKNTVTISITKVSNEENKDITEIVQKKGSQPLIDRAIEFSLDLDGQEITDFHRIYVDRTITVHSTVDPNKVTAIWLDSNKKVQFIPSTITNSDGVANVIIHSTHNSKYSVIQSNSSFTDMQGHWAKQDIELMANKNIVDGVSDSKFAPEQLITRAEFAAILVRSLGLLEQKPMDNLMDVKVTDWYSGVINTANKTGLISGFEDGSFHPNTTITREQMVTMIARSLNLVGKEAQVNLSLLSKFEDQSEIAEWAKNAVAISIAAKIIQGKSGFSFEAKGNATRAEAVTLLKRMLVYVDFIN